MFLKIILMISVVCVVITSAVPSDGLTRASLWPQDLQTPFPYPTPTPINGSVSETRNLSDSVPSNLVIKAKRNVEYLLTNTGSYVGISTLSPNSLSTIEGGFLGSYYVFNRAHLFWSGNVNQAASSTVDGEGPPVEIRLIYVNSNYSTFSEALCYRDGLVTVVVKLRVSADQAPNSAYEPFRQQLALVSGTGQSRLVSSHDLFQWLHPNTTITNYFALPGAYIDVDHNRQQYYSSTIIGFPPEYWPSISYSQFATFLNLRNAYGSPYVNVLISQPRGLTPVVFGKSIEVVSY